MSRGGSCGARRMQARKGIYARFVLDAQEGAPARKLPAERRCLRCRRMFPSFSCGNRMCGGCLSLGDVGS